MYSTFGGLHTVLSDNDPEFGNMLFMQIASTLGMKQVFSSPCYPNGNGHIENVHNFLKHAYGSISPLNFHGRSGSHSLCGLQYPSVTNKNKEPQSTITLYINLRPQEPANIMQIQVCDQAVANLSVSISGVNVIALYEMGFNMSCMSCACYLKLKDPPSLSTVSTMSVHSTTGYDLNLVGLICCGDTIGKSQFKHTFIMCKKLQKELVIDLDVWHGISCNL